MIDFDQLLNLDEFKACVIVAKLIIYCLYLLMVDLMRPHKIIKP